MLSCPRAGCGRSARPARWAGCGNGVMVRLLGHRQTKGAATDKPGLPPPRHIPTLLHQRKFRLACRIATRLPRSWQAQSPKVGSRFSRS